MEEILNEKSSILLLLLLLTFSAFPDSKRQPPVRGDSDFRVLSMRFNSWKTLIQDLAKTNLENNYSVLKNRFEQMDEEKYGFVTVREFKVFINPSLHTDKLIGHFSVVVLCPHPFNKFFKNGSFWKIKDILFSIFNRYDHFILMRFAASASRTVFEFTPLLWAKPLLTLAMSYPKTNALYDTALDSKIYICYLLTTNRSAQYSVTQIYFNYNLFIYLFLFIIRG